MECKLGKRVCVVADQLEKKVLLGESCWSQRVVRCSAATLCCGLDVEVMAGMDGLGW
jgi:hypothetical protein